MREGREAKVVINDADENSVRELVCFLCTGNINENSNFVLLLPLAHRYGVSDLVEICASSIADDLCPENVVSSLAALRRFREDDIVKKHWNNALNNIRSSESLTKAFAEFITAELMSRHAIGPG